MLALVQRVPRGAASRSTARSSARSAAACWCSSAPSRPTTTRRPTRCVAKLLKLRIFADDAGKMNRSVQDVRRRPADRPPVHAGRRHRRRQPAELHRRRAARSSGRALYERVLALARERHPQVASGEFGADMQVQLVNDGPVTIPIASLIGVKPKGAPQRRPAGSPARALGRQSAYCPAALITGPHLLISASTNFLCSAGFDARVGDDHGAQRLLALDEVGVLQRRLQRGVDLVEHRLRRALRRVQARARSITLKPFRPDSSSVGSLASAGVVRRLGVVTAIGLDLAALDLRGGVGGLVAHDVDLAADQVGHRRRGALVRHGLSCRSSGSAGTAGRTGARRRRGRRWRG